MFSPKLYPGMAVSVQASPEKRGSQTHFAYTQVPLSLQVLPSGDTEHTGLSHRATKTTTWKIRRKTKKPVMAAAICLAPPQQRNALDHLFSCSLALHAFSLAAFLKSSHLVERA